MRVVVLGAAGLLGRALVQAGREAGEVVLALPRSELDIADEAALERALGSFRPEAIYNAAAYTDVDRAEGEGAESNERANAVGPRLLARAARRFGSRLVHVSTDYVFDGAKDAPYDEDDPPAPLSAYARAKLDGEAGALDEGPPGATIVARTAWVYGPGGKNFVSKIPEILRAKGEMSVVGDQWSSPTRADELAGLLRALLERRASGLFHAAATGVASYHDCAVEAARSLGIEPAKVRSISSVSIPRPAARPRRSALASKRLAALGLAPLRPWAESYREYCAGARA